VLAIENKIWTSEHDGQLTRYKENIYKLYPTTKYKHFFVYLSTEDEEVSDDIDEYDDEKDIPKREI
jgi:hypothetical protein